jgi:CubicO group peptidase (beta-lactamase class C family)
MIKRSNSLEGRILIMKKLYFFSLALVLLLGVFIFICPGISEPQGTDVYRIPEKLNDGWEVTSLSEVGVDTGKIEQITQEIRNDERFDLIHSMLIVKDGKLVHEAYFWGYQRNSLNVMASISKSVTSTLIGIAIDKGFIKSVDESVVSLLPEYPEPTKDPKKQAIKLKHILTMSSGLDWLEHGTSYNDLENSEYQMVDSEDWMEYVLSKPMKDIPGTRFLYNTGGIHLLSAVIQSTTGMRTNIFAEKHLFEPLGIYAYQWNRDSTGHPCTGGTDGGVGLRTRDIAKFGWLFLHDGKWKGKQVISEEWVKLATRRHIKNPRGGQYYGYCWFPGTLKREGKEVEYVASFGYGGQTLYLIPELDLIIVFTCELTDRNTYVSIPVRKTFDAIFQN